ncbi:hypothetical protein OSTOST_03890, partial [Ostertagia ostertagi]
MSLRSTTLGKRTISHAVGIVPSVVVFWHMVTISHRDLQFYLMIVYGLFTTLLFSSSTCYHAQASVSASTFSSNVKLQITPEHFRQTRLRYYLHICDRAAIYLFIAASYTPWLTLRHCGYPGLNLKWMIWVFAFLGILYQYNFHERFKTLETLLYIFSIVVSGLRSVAFHYGASCHTYAVYSTLLGPDPNNPVPDLSHLEL